MIEICRRAVSTTIWVSRAERISFHACSMVSNAPVVSYEAIAEQEELFHNVCRNLRAWIIFDFAQCGVK